MLVCFVTWLCPGNASFIFYPIRKCKIKITFVFPIDL